MTETYFSNPILPGFHPDPSICRVGEDYYLVNSTFAYFPGVPIYHSKDLVHWMQIGNVLNRSEQIDLTDIWHSGGIYAPTLRYHNGTFYMITTNVGHGGNFIVTATSPTGPWSNPYFIENANGIDPSLFFDDDGRCYYCGTQGKRDGEAFWGDNEIYIQELDLSTMQLIGPSYAAWHGALKNTEWAEGPHLYKKDGYYYLLIAEGGTGFNHAVTIARSKDLSKPFDGCIRNPILTHRHLGKNYPIVYTGHADLFETQYGDWYFVLLASRPCNGHTLLGRETFLVPVTWEDGWPIVNYGIGLVEEKIRAPFNNVSENHNLNHKIFEDFLQEQLPFNFLYLRNPKMDNYKINTKESCLRLYASSNCLTSTTSPTALLIRQTNFCYTLETKLSLTILPSLYESSDNHPDELSLSNGSFEAGTVLMQSNEFHYRFTVSYSEHCTSIKLIKCEQGRETIVTYSNEKLLFHNTHSNTITSPFYYLKVVAKYNELSFFYSDDGNEYQLVAEQVDASILSTEQAGGFVGTCLGIYAQYSSNSEEDNTPTQIDNKRRYADFDWLSYKE